MSALQSRTFARVADICWALAATRRPACWARALALALAALLAGPLVSAQQVEWSRPLGNEFLESPLATDASGVYAPSGYSESEPDRQPLVRKFDSAGRVLWTRQVAGNPAVVLTQIAADSTGVYVAGHRVYQDPKVVLVARLSADGQLRWARRLPSFDDVEALAVHSSGIYLAASNNSGGYFVKLDRDGRIVWSRLWVPGNVSREDYLQNMVVDDSGLYVAGQLTGADVRQYDLDGHLVRSFGSGDAILGEVAVDASGVYVSNFWPRAPRAPVLLLRKYAHDGRTLWSRRSRLSGYSYSVNNMRADATGIYVSGPVRAFSYVSGGFVSRFTPGGDELWAHIFGSESLRPTFRGGLAVSNGDVYVSGIRYGEAVSPVLSKLSPDIAPRLQALGDLDGNGTPEVAVLRRQAAPKRLTASIKDAGTGAALRSIAFDAAYWPQQMVRIADAGSPGAEMLAVLGMHEVTGAVVAEVRDARDGSLFSRVRFDSTYSAKKLLVLPDIDGNGVPELALAQTNNQRTPHRPTVEIRDARTGRRLQRLEFSNFLLDGPDDEEAYLLDFAVVPDGDGDGSPEIVVMGATVGGDFESDISVEARDARSGRLTAAVLSSEVSASTQTTTLPAADGSGRSLLALLYPASPLSEVQVVDLATGEPVRTVAFDGIAEGQEARDLLTMPDLNGNGHAELAYMFDGATMGTIVVQIKDGTSAASIARHLFRLGGFVSRGLAVTADVNGNGSADLVLLQERRSDNKARAEVKDGLTGELIRRAEF